MIEGIAIIRLQKDIAEELMALEINDPQPSSNMERRLNID